MAPTRSAAHGNTTRIKTVIFDLGGTLIFFDGDWARVIQQSDAQLVQAVHAAGMLVDEKAFPTRFRAALQNYFVERETEFIEYTTAYILRQALAEYGFTVVGDEVVQEVLASMYAVTQAYWRADPDAHPTLEMLQQRGYRLGLISNAGDDADVQKLLDQSGLRSYFEVILTSAMQGIRKPNPKIFLTALNQLETQPAQAVMVGDTLGADVLGAQIAGLFSIFITRYADTPANRAHFETILPDATIAGLGELPELLDRLEQSLG